MAGEKVVVEVEVPRGVDKGLVEEVLRREARKLVALLAWKEALGRARVDRGELEELVREVEEGVWERVKRKLEE